MNQGDIDRMRVWGGVTNDDNKGSYDDNAHKPMANWEMILIIVGSIVLSIIVIVLCVCCFRG